MNTKLRITTLAASVCLLGVSTATFALPSVQDSIDGTEYKINKMMELITAELKSTVNSDGAYTCTVDDASTLADAGQIGADLVTLAVDEDCVAEISVADSNDVNALFRGAKFNLIGVSPDMSDWVKQEAEIDFFRCIYEAGDADLETVEIPGAGPINLLEQSKYPILSTCDGGAFAHTAVS